MLIFKAEILKSKQKVDGTYNVKIRITTPYDVSHLRHLYGISVTQAWHEVQRFAISDFSNWMQDGSVPQQPPMYVTP